MITKSALENSLYRVGAALLIAIILSLPLTAQAADEFPKLTPELMDKLNESLDTTWPHDPAVPVGCEFLFKRLLAADTNHGNKISIGSCPSKRCSVLRRPASDRGAGLRSLGEHVPDYNSP